MKLNSTQHHPSLHWVCVCVPWYAVWQSAHQRIPLFQNEIFRKFSQINSAASQSTQNKTNWKSVGLKPKERMWFRCKLLIYLHNRLNAWKSFIYSPILIQVLDDRNFMAGCCWLNVYVCRCMSVVYLHTLERCQIVVYYAKYSVSFPSKILYFTLAHETFGDCCCFCCRYRCCRRLKIFRSGRAAIYLAWLLNFPKNHQKCQC